MVNSKVVLSSITSSELQPESLLLGLCLGFIKKKNLCETVNYFYMHALQLEPFIVHVLKR